MPVFLESTNVGRTPGPPAAKETDEKASESSEWEKRERGRERLAEMRAEAERSGGVGRNRRRCVSCFLLSSLYWFEAKGV